VTIALDATYSLGEELSGLGIYSREILFGLARAHPETRFAFYYRPQRYRASRSQILPRNVGRCLLLDLLPPRSELFHGLNQRLPKLRTRRAVATFHDLFVLSAEYSTPEFRARFAVQARDAATRADAIIAVSHFTKSQVMELLGVEASRIHVVHHGVRQLPLPPNPPAREKIVLSVGAIQKRKNTARLVEAFEAVDPGWRLVLAGSAGFGSADILARIASSKARDRIDVTGYVSPAELSACYARASVFAFPSLDEGFGMPVLEAMAAGTPVVASNCSALPEVVGNAALMVDPTRVDSIAEALRTITADEDLRSDLIQKGWARVEEFRWEKAVEKTWRVYELLTG
jgi:glycosyltransferase involved in cell wall biosynthesis